MTTATDAAALAIANLVAATDAVVAASHDLIIEASQLPEVTAAIESQTARLAGVLQIVGEITAPMQKAN